MHEIREVNKMEKEVKKNIRQLSAGLALLGFLSPLILILALLYIKVDINNGTIDVIVTKRIKGVFGKMFNFNLTDVSCHYMGKMVLDKKVIERV